MEWFLLEKSAKDLVRYILKLKSDKKKLNKFSINSRSLAVKKFEEKR